MKVTIKGQDYSASNHVIVVELNNTDQRPSTEGPSIYWPKEMTKDECEKIINRDLPTQWVKLFDTPKGQVLVKKSFDPDEEVCQVEFEMDAGGFMIKMKHGFKDESDRDKAFDMVGYKEALNQLEIVESMQR